MVGTSRHHVAIISVQCVRSLGTQGVRRPVLGDCKWLVGRRWQSTAAKEAVIPNHPHTSNSRHEIPSGCFVESAAFPVPSLTLEKTSNTIDLSSTRPASLDSPSAPERRDYPDGNIPIGDRAKYLFKLGKSFLLFYKTGLKNVWSNSKRYRALRSGFQGYALNNVAKFGGQTIDNKLIPQISRSEYQLCLRTRHDVFKMLPFSLVFLICGEFTPLIIIALGSSVVPYTCRIPRQEQNDLEKSLKRDDHYMEDLQRVYPDVETPLETPDWRVEHLDAYRLGLTSIRAPVPIIGQLYHILITRPRLVRHCDNIVADTILIHRQGGPVTMTHEDIFEWANSYGLYAFRQYVKECQRNRQDPRSAQLKRALLPKIESEMKYIINQVAEWSRLKPNEQWRVGLRTVGSSSPDWRSRVHDIRKNWKLA